MKGIQILFNLPSLKKRLIKKIITPKDILFLALSFGFLGIVFIELFDIVINLFNSAEGYFHYLLQIKYHLLFWLASVIIFVSTVILWLKYKVISFISFFLPNKRKKQMYWLFLVFAFTLNSCFYVFFI